MNLRYMICTVVLALVGASMAASAATLRIGTEGSYPPWNTVDASGTVIGFDADVGQAVCTKLGADCRFVVQAFDSLIPTLEKGRFDLVMSGMSINAERAKVIGFSIPYARSDVAFVLPKDDPLVQAKDTEALLQGLAGKRVGVLSGTTEAAFLAKHAPDLDVAAYDAETQMQQDLMAGRLDATFSDFTPQVEFVEQAGKSGFVVADHVIEGSEDLETLGPGVGIGIGKDNAELQGRVNQALCELIADGTMSALSQKWFHFDLTNRAACE